MKPHLKFSKSLARDLLAEQPKKQDKTVRSLDMVWTSKGRRITPKEMDDNHLLNSIRLLERQAVELKLRLKLSQTPAEIASASFPIHDVMVDELERRLKESSKTAPVLTITPHNRKFKLDDE